MTQKAVLLALVAVAVGIIGACAETRRTVGSDCLKSQDCLSGICSQLVCVAAPPTTSEQAQADATAPTDGGGGDTGSSSGADAPTEAATEAATEAGGDAASDGPVD